MSMGLDPIDGIPSSESTSTSTTSKTESNLSLAGSVRFRSVPPPAHFWTHDSHSRAYVFKLFTCFYALFIVITGVIIELSNLIYNEGENSLSVHMKDLLLGIWLFGGSIVFISYCAFLVWKHHRHVMAERRSLAAGLTFGPLPEVLSNSSTGSLYLRIGCVVFGLIGCIYYGLIFVICILGWSYSEEAEHGDCGVVSNTLNFLAGMFIFVQMWFVYCNGKVIFTGNGTIARLGLMHLCGTNLWMWLRYILYEEVETVAEIRRAQNVTSPVHVENYHHAHTHEGEFSVASWEPYPDVNHGLEGCRGVLCLFQGYNEFMYTCVVEYSLICAGVAFVFWTSISSVRDAKADRRVKKRSMLTIDCSRTAEGLFLGFGFIIATIITIAVFNAYSSKKELAQWLFSCTNLLLFAISTAVCVFALYRMQVLKFVEEKEEEEESAELLDQILLVVGIIGELIFSIGGLFAFLNGRDISNLAIIMFLTNLFRLVQVTLQSGLIFVSSKLILNAEDREMVRYKPGKQVITLLLMINCAQFLMNVFEAQKAGVDEEIVRMYGSYYWAIIVRGCSPLTIFYRFHSSACFAEIWKKTYKTHHSKRKYDTHDANLIISAETGL